MSEQPSLDYLKNRNVFIWQGAWKGGAEAVTFGIADFLLRHGVTPTLGVFKGEQRTDLPYPQIECPRIFPKRYVAYNNLFASLWLRRSTKVFDIIVTHTAGAWRQPGINYFYREPGDLRALFKSLSYKSKLGYALPYLAAKWALNKANPAIAASKRAEAFFESIGVKTFLSTQNFLTTTPPQPSQRSYDSNEPLQLVFVGRDDKIKNLPWLERFCADASLNIHLHVIGVNKLNTQHITYHGWVSQSEVQSFMQNAHALILPSLFEASPLVLIDALAQGLPVLVSKNAAPLELHKQIIQFDDDQTLTEAITLLQNNYTKIADERFNEADEIRDRFNVDHVLMHEWLAICEHLQATDPANP
ncbi:glycosyltransferase family 4 protein [Candidatus Uhrbacteria bacterium]|nr:glycosyltransferase family 4 protein [Candidatus Uhrbacteria bacterium]